MKSLFYLIAIVVIISGFIDCGKEMDLAYKEKDPIRFPYWYIKVVGGLLFIFLIALT